MTDKTTVAMTADGPQTATGRAVYGDPEVLLCLDHNDGHVYIGSIALRTAILAIEQEAKAAADAQLRVLREALRDVAPALIGGQPCYCFMSPRGILRHMPSCLAARALLDAAADEPTERS